MHAPEPPGPDPIDRGALFLVSNRGQDLMDLRNTNPCSPSLGIDGHHKVARVRKSAHGMGIECQESPW